MGLSSQPTHPIEVRVDEAGVGDVRAGEIGMGQASPIEGCVGQRNGLHFADDAFSLPED